MAFIAIAGGAIFGGGAFGSLAFNAVLGLGMLGLSWWLQSQQKITGPRLEDLEVKDQPIGSPIPIHFGTGAFYCPWIWIRKNKLIEKKTETSAGKGGPTIIEYSYYITGAVACCDNKQDALVKMWMNSEVIVDRSFKSGSFRTQASWARARFRVHLGTETQQPDNWMEQVLGVGNTPAYRGLCYIVFKELPLEKAGNVVPQIRVVMTSSGTENFLGPDYARPTGTEASPAALQDKYDSGRLLLSGGELDADIYKYDIPSGDLSPVQGLVDVDIDNWTVDAYGHLYLRVDDVIYSYNSRTYQPLGSLDISNAIGTSGIRTLDRVLGGQWVLTEGTDTEDEVTYRFHIHQILVDTAASTSTEGSVVGNPFFNTFDSYYRGDVNNETLTSSYYGQLLGVDHNDALWVMGTTTVDANDTYLCVYRLGHSFPISNWYGEVTGVGSIRKILEHVEVDGDWTVFGMDIRRGGYFPDEGVIVLIGHKDGDPDENILIRKYDPDPTTAGYYYGELSLISETELGGTGGHGGMATQTNYAGQGFKEGRIFILMGDKTIYGVDLALESIVCTIGPSGIPTNYTSSIYIEEMESAIVWKAGVDPQLIYCGNVQGDLVSLKTIVDDIDLRVAMPTGRSNTLDLIDTYITGYTFQDLQAVSQDLQDIMVVMGVEIADWGAYNKWILRGEQTPITIDPTELGAAEGVEPSDFDLQIEIAEGYELPKIMQLKHYDPDAEFEMSIQEYARHSAVVSTVDINTYNTKTILEADEAKSRLRDMFKALWRARASYELPLPPKFRQYAPGDVFEVTYDGLLHQFMATECTFDDGVVKIRGTGENVDDWRIEITGQSSIIPPAIVTEYSDPVLWLLDANAGRDLDVTQQFYVATHAYNPNDEYPGCFVMRGTDPASLSGWKAFTNVVYYGNVVTAAPPCPYPQIPQDGPLIVEIPAIQGFSPASVTLEQIQNDRQLNPMMIICLAPDGSVEVEWLQYATVTYLGNDVWQFEDLIRGQRGTEFLVNQHVAGNGVLFPTETTLAREGETENLGSLRYYQATTVGKIIPNDNPIFSFTNNGKGVRPYAPADLGATRNSSGDAIIDWKRRAKIYGFWVEGEELPLDESVEQYNIYIYEDDTKAVLLRTINNHTSSTYTYTLANYNTDASASETVVPLVYVEVGQIGDIFGEGVLAGGTI